MKKIILISAIALSLNISAADSYSKDQVNEFECSPEEMTSILSQDKVKDRITQTSYSAFAAPYQEANVSEKSGKQPDKITQEDKEENDGGLSCLAINPEDINKIWEALEGVGKIITDGFSAAGELFDKMGEELTKGFCEKMKTQVTAFAGMYGDSAKKNLEAKLRKEKWGKLLDGESGLDSIINKQIDSSYEDKAGLLNWRKGGLDKDNFKNKSNRLFQNEISDLYDDFDDQVDEKAGID
jgi:hypothetical protein